MDDETLACGGTLASLANKTKWHILFASDGSKVPPPASGVDDNARAQWGQRRQREAIAALHVLGVPASNVHFLGFPDGRLQSHLRPLRAALVTLLATLQPDHLLVPFRYDRHPDHLAVNRLARLMKASGEFEGILTEYFTYTRWRMLPRQDIRDYIHPASLFSIDIGAVADLKREALACFTTQTTCYFPWQHRPVLTPDLLEAVCSEPERFFRPPTGAEAAPVFRDAAGWIRTVHWLEPRIKRYKDHLIGSLRHWK